MLSKKRSISSDDRLFLHVSKGKIRCKQGDFESISGSIARVYKQKHTKNGEDFYYWHILMDDKEHGEFYDIAFNRTSEAFKNVISSLISPTGIDSLGDITIDVSSYDGVRTFADVSSRGQRIHWSDERMPSLERVMQDGKSVIDDTVQQAWLLSAANRINARIADNSHV